MNATKIADRLAPVWVAGWLVLSWVGCTPPGPAALLEGEILLEAGEYPAAIRRFQEATDLLGDHPEAWNFLGLAHHKAGESAAATKAYKRALELNVDLLAARYNLGCLLLENEEFQAAEDQFKTYAIMAEGDPQVSVKLGSAQLGDGRLNEAEESFEAALKRNRAFPEAWNGLGLIRLYRGNGREAFHYFNTAIEQDDRFGPAYLNQAVVAHHYLNDLPLALKKYRRFLFLDPKSEKSAQVKAAAAAIEEALAPRSMVQEEGVQAEEEVAAAGQTEAILETGEPEPSDVAPETPQEKDQKPGPDEVVRSNESPEDVSKGAEPPLNEGNEEEAAEVVIVEPDPPVEAQETSGETSEAEAPAEEVEMARPDPGSKENQPEIVFEKVGIPPLEPEFVVAESRPEPRDDEAISDSGWRTVETRRSGMGISVGRTLFRNQGAGSNEPSEASEENRVGRVPSLTYEYRRPLTPVAGDRKQASPYFQQGNEAFKTGQESEAILAYREAVSRDPAFFAAHYNMGLAAIRSGLTETALDAYENALAINPGDRNARYNFALALEQGRHHSEAATELNSLLSSFPDDVHAHFTLATLYAKKIGDGARARQHYQKVLNLDPNYPNAVSIRYWLSASD